MNKTILKKELQYKAVRSSGAGGQNVNKVATKVVVWFDISNSMALNKEEKDLILLKLKNKISQENIISLTTDSDRSQLKNKTIVTKKILELLEKALQKPKPRVETKIPKIVIEKRLKEKKSNSEIKENRKKLDF